MAEKVIEVDYEKLLEYLTEEKRKLKRESATNVSICLGTYFICLIFVFWIFHSSSKFYLALTGAIISPIPILGIVFLSLLENPYNTSHTLKRNRER